MNRGFPQSYYRLPTVAALLVAAGLQSCALFNKQQADSASVVIGCNLPSDQVQTLEGTWNAKPPIHIAFHSGDFTSAQIGAMTAAADIWNAHFSAARQFTSIDYGGATPRISNVPKESSTQLCTGQGIVSNDAFNGSVVIYKDEVTWPYSPGSGIIALTSWCPQPAKTTLIYNAMMELNFVEFFSAGKLQPDLTTIALHEFGHMQGINHSCENSSKPGFPLCQSANPEYATAVMKPAVTFDSSTGQGEVNTVLNDDDQGRANCLWGG